MKPTEAKKLITKFVNNESLEVAYKSYFIQGGLEELYVSFADFCIGQRVNEKNVQATFKEFIKELRANLTEEQKTTLTYSKPFKKNHEVDRPYLVRDKIYIPTPPKAEVIRGDLSHSKSKDGTLPHFKEIMARIKEKVANLTNGADFARLCCDGLAKGITRKMDYRVGSRFITKFWEDNKDNPILPKAVFVCQFLGYDSIPLDFEKGEFNEEFILRHFKRIISNKDLPINSWRYWFIDLTGDRRSQIFNFYQKRLSRLEINEIFIDFYDQNKDRHESKEELYKHFDRWFNKINFKYLHQNNDT